MLSNHCAEPSIIRKPVTCYSPVEKNVTMVKEDSTAGELGRFCTILNTRSMLIDNLYVFQYRFLTICSTLF